MSRRLLVVDDEASIVFSISEYFATLGWEVEEAEDLPTALARLGASRFDLVIADLRLTGSRGTEGLEVVAQVRRGSPSTKAILLTAYGTPEIEVRALECGADTVLYKPVPLSTLAGLADRLVADESSRPPASANP